MVQVGEIFERMRFVVRDLARESGKEIRLELRGQETEIDKFLVERMTDPLLHLVRNAVSHGLETADERVAKGKPPEGRLTLARRDLGRERPDRDSGRRARHRRGARRRACARARV